MNYDHDAAIRADERYFHSEPGDKHRASGPCGCALLADEAYNAHRCERNDGN